MRRIRLGSAATRNAGGSDNPPGSDLVVERLLRLLTTAGSFRYPSFFSTILPRHPL